ncbi:MAG TPA: sigma 54-interacting transcriptional regulator, partial [Terriglobia bacterium]|nr:sigma 54-interacting transcriptional regulator [Terriglobia bacterium]
MNPTIVAISGPLKGSPFLIDESDLVIGRGRSCQVCLDDPSVSLRHCSISCGDGYSLLLDLGSAGGTFTNGFCFPLKVLVHGDRVRIGRSMFVYVESDEIDPAMLKLTPAEEQCDRLGATQRAGAYEAARTTVLEAFLQIAASINGIHDAAEIQSRVLELIFQVISVERAAILLFGHDQDRIISGTYRRVGSQNDEPFPIDESLAAQALRGGVRTGDDKVVCYPLTAFDTKVGLIYAVMAKDGDEFFTAGHMHLLESIAGFAAVALEHARYVAWLEGENRRLNEFINIEHGMIGRSERVREVYQFINRAGPSDRTVLITGESGTGKELVAHAIHRNSPRSNKGFHAVNCGAFAENLLGSELFGHEKGAFTSADRQRKGLFECADGGTVFLDEIGELPVTMQPDLLRVLQQGEFKRLGGNDVIRVNVRVIAATNRNLQQEIKEARFRADLFFRLNVLEIHMPRLSERREDIPLIAAHFIKKYGQIRTGTYPAVQGISPEAHRFLASYAWPGNVRELENVIERAIALGVSPYVQPEDLPKAITSESAEVVEVNLWDK